VTITPTPTGFPTPTPEPGEEEAEDTGAEAEIPTPTAVAPIVPTITPTPYTLDAFQENYQEVINRFNEEINFSEADFLALIRSQLYRQKLIEAITADLPHEEDQVWARHILVEDEETALDLLDKLEEGEDWAVLAAEYSIDASNKDRGGDLGWFNSTTMVAEFSKVAFNTSIGKISAPAQTSFGWHLIQVLGHEMRPLDSYGYDQLRQEQFQAWLQQAKLDTEIEISETWTEHVPEEPIIPPELLLDTAAAQPLDAQP
jgi:parvulin-like peptidyl-prolyl isomerase